MRTRYDKILVFGVIAAALLAAPLPSRAVEGGREVILSEEETGFAERRLELTDEIIERIMRGLAKSDPEKAEELEKLRKEKPAQFEAEIRQIMHERARERNRRRGERGVRRRAYDSEESPRKGGVMREKYAEYIKWLNENYPEKAERMKEIKERDPKLYKKHLKYGHKRYWRIAEAEEDSPELAENLKKDLELKQARNDLLKKIDAADEDEKKKLVGELEKTVNKRFGLIVERRQMEYEKMRKKLERLQKRLQEKQVEVEKWQNAEFKSEHIKRRIEELVSQSGRFDWE